ncbi:hypothetical protein Tco_0433042 [Tanacetum coccineum]
MLKKFGLEDSKPTKTPMSTEIKLTKDDEADSVDSSKYRGMIGSLLYLTASKPDIMFSVCLCARFQENPKTTHLEAVKRIFRYIRETTHLGLWYPKGTGIETIVYADSDHAGDYVDQKSTSGICTFMGCCLTSWLAKKQTALAISTIEAEYVSAGKACQQALWMKQALIDYDIRLDDISILCDNKGAIYLSKNPVQHSRTKHIEIRHHFLRDNIQKGNISIEKVASEDNIADIFTKPLKREILSISESSKEKGKKLLYSNSLHLPFGGNEAPWELVESVKLPSSWVLGSGVGEGASYELQHFQFEVIKDLVVQRLVVPYNVHSSNLRGLAYLVVELCNRQWIISETDAVLGVDPPSSINGMIFLLHHHSLIGLPYPLSDIRRRVRVEHYFSPPAVTGMRWLQDPMSAQLETKPISSFIALNSLYTGAGVEAYTKGTSVAGATKLFVVISSVIMSVKI